MPELLKPKLKNEQSSKATPRRGGEYKMNETTTKIRLHTPAQIRALITDQIERNGFWQIGAITPQQIAALTTNQIGALTTDQMGAITTEQVAALTDEQIRALTSAQFAALTLDQTEGLTAAQIDSMTTAQIDILFALRYP